MSQYNFRKEVSLAMIFPDKYWPTRERGAGGDDGSSVGVGRRIAGSTCTTPSTKSKRIQDQLSTSTNSGPFRNRVVTDNSLHPILGSLCCRLDHLKTHWPAPCSKVESRCQLHFWATGGKKHRKNLMVCSECQITLCIQCYVPFHTVENLVGNKLSMGVIYAPEDDDGTPRKKQCLGF